MLTQWYCRIMGVERGPVTIEELRSLVHCGELAVCDLVRSESEPAWVRADSVSDLFDAASDSLGATSLSGDNLATGDMHIDGNSWCSLELQSTDTKTSIRWTTPGAPTVANAAASKLHKPLVRVPHRTLKVGHGATKAGREEKRAHQSTLANGFDVEADTVETPDLAQPLKSDATESAEHRL